ncbi:AAA family ATPase [Rhodobacter maris]|uniref:AAA ATPase-like protein n=1 Tax=Rhodobacter maris TaxID=446682 RepID=A0A285TFK2_9RHOB|nr:AAA ATPase-like protein [Rhodobacter maris]
MRIDRVYIDGFSNLKDVEADFDEGCLTTVIIGQNGAGKSNLIEAIVEIFRHLDPPNSKHGGKLRFTFEVDYIIKGRNVRASNRDGSTKVTVDGEPMPMGRFLDSKGELFPDLVFGYYYDREPSTEIHEGRRAGCVIADQLPVRVRAALEPEPNGPKIRFV